jgi:DNA-binding NtrC family response regulator
MESELFGHVRGAFTGADRDRDGLLAAASGGTLFLDGIGELPLRLQPKLLGAIDRRAITPVGGTQPVPIQIRVIAATHRNLAVEVNQGRFRADLYYRLAVVRLRVPPLRERADDIPLLVEGRLGELRARGGATVPAQLSAVAMARLMAQAWPGNVRELLNAVEALVYQLPAGAPEKEAMRISPFFTTRAQAEEEFHRRYFTALLDEGANLSEVARRAGLDRRYLARILKRHGIARP